MKIQTFAVFEMALPREDPKWKVSGEVYPKNKACAVGLKADDGIVG